MSEPVTRPPIYPLRVALIYATCAGLWIVFSDLAVEWLLGAPATITLASTLKGWTFVVVTSLLLYALLRRRGSVVQQAQSERLRALHLLAAIADSSTDAIFAKDLEGRYLLFNRETARVIGKTDAEALGHDDTALFPPEQAEMIRTNDRLVIAENRVNTYEETLNTSQGERTFLATKGPLHDSAGKVIGLFGISRDITERKIAETALRERLALQDQLSRIAASAPGMICSWKQRPDGSACMPYASPAIVDLLGLRPEDVADDATPFYQRVHPDDLQRVADTVAEAARTHSPWHDQYRYLHPSKGERWIEGWSSPRDEADGSIVWHGFSMDVTERKQAEAALHTSEMSYRSLFKNMLNGYAHCRMLYENGEPKDFVYLDVNEAFVAQTGLRDVVGRKVSEVIPGIREADPGLFEIYGRVAMSGQPERLEIYVEAMRMWFAISVYSPQREHFVALFDVINERKQAEEALRWQTQELRTRNEELERFNRATVGRELDMIALKQQVNTLSCQLGQKPPYSLSFLDTPSAQREEGEMK